MGQYLTDSPIETPDTITVETEYSKEEGILVDGLSERWSETALYGTVLSTRDAVDASVSTDEDRISSFIEETDLDESSLAVVQYGGSSDEDVDVRSVETEADRLRVELSVDSPSSGTDDFTVHSALLRIRDETDDVPGEIVVSTADDRYASS